MLEAIKARGLQAGGLALAGRGSRPTRSLLATIGCVDAAEHGCWDQGCRYGPAGTLLGSAELGDEIDRRGLATMVEADGGIRRHTVPQIARAGADYIVPGSLMFKEDPGEMREWLAKLG